MTVIPSIDPSCPGGSPMSVPAVPGTKRATASTPGVHHGLEPDRPCRGLEVLGTDLRSLGSR